MKQLVVGLVIFGLVGWSFWGIRLYKYTMLAAKEVSWSDVDLLVERAQETDKYKKSYEECLVELAR